MKIRPEEFRHNITRDYLKQCLEASSEERLLWLEEVNNFVRRALPKKKILLWVKIKRKFI